MHNSIFFLVDPKTDRFWDCRWPPMYGGARGHAQISLIERINDWKPRFLAINELEKAVYYKHQLETVETAVALLESYNQVRRIRRDLPELVVSEHEMCFLPKRTIRLKATPQIEMVQILFFYYGCAMAKDYEICFEEPSHEAIFAATIRISKPKIRKHLPDAKLGIGWVFMNEGDAMMLKLISKKAVIYDLRPCLQLIETPE